MPQASGELGNVPFNVAPEDILRAQCYRLLARFLSAPPAQTDLEAAGKLTGDSSDLGKAIAIFARVCTRSNVQAVAEEYHTLFIGLVRGELVPYGSYYLTGFLHEKPLAKLRQDMSRLGLERDPGVSEPEDHIASVCEIMAGLIDGEFGQPFPLEEQKRFFEAHFASWAAIFFRDLEIAKSAVLYATLASVGRLFLEVETTAFGMA
jgi:TorA maturation chaperone TorD